MTRRIHHFIGGDPIADGATFEKRSPVDASPIAIVDEGDAALVDRAVRAARAAQPAWAARDRSARAAVLRDCADAIEHHADALAAADADDIGRPVGQVRFGHVARTVETFRLYANLLDTETEQAFHGRAAGPGGGTAPPSTLAYTVRHPRGVVGIIAPWNVPVLLLALNLAPALAAGNAVVAKPSEESPSSAALLAEILHDAGLPAGVFNVVHGKGAGSTGAALTAHPGINAFAFTGEGRTGEAIQRSAATGLRDVLFELGGKNAGIVFADADFDRAVDACLRAAVTNSGQVCLSIERVYVERPIYDRFVAALATVAQAVVFGDADGGPATIGPLISHRHRDKVRGALDGARADGACVQGGDIPRLGDARDAGCWLHPAVVTGLADDHPFNREEAFGPVVHVAPFDDEDEVIARANDTDFGLAAMCWTRDLSRAHRVAGAMRAGISWVNSWQVRDFATPLQGRGASGIGVQGGRASLDFFSTITTVTIAL